MNHLLRLLLSIVLLVSPLAASAAGSLTIAAGAILAAGRGLGEIGISLMLGGNIIGRTETLSLAIFNHVTDGNFVCANTLSLLLAGLAALVFFLVKRFGAL